MSSTSGGQIKALSSCSRPTAEGRATTSPGPRGGGPAPTTAPATGRGSWRTRACRRRSRRAQSAVVARAGCGTGCPSRRGGRGASRCGTARARSGPTGCWRTECVVSRRSFERCIPPCSAIERSRLITRHTVRYGAQPEEEVQPQATERRWPTAMSTDLHAEDLPGRAPSARRPSSAAPRSRPLQQLPAGLAVASRTSLRRNDRGDGVAAVERDVGLVGSELVAVVRHVAAPVEVGRRERRVAEQPAPDPVVGRAVAEQQAVGGLVHQRGELRVRPTHEQEGQERPDAGCRSNRGDDDADRLHVVRRRCSALRKYGMRRSSARNGGTARPDGRIGPSGAGTVQQHVRGEHRGDGGRRHEHILPS